MWRRKQGSESSRSSDSSRKRLPTPEKRRSPTPEKRRGQSLEAKRVISDGRRTPTPERRRRNSEPSLGKNPNRPVSKTVIKQSNNPKTKDDPHIRQSVSPRAKDDQHIKQNNNPKAKEDLNNSKSNLKVKLKNKGIVTKEAYPIHVIKTRNKQSLTDHLKSWDTIEPNSSKISKKGKESSITKQKKNRTSLKVLMRRQIWNMSKPAIRHNNHWKQLLQDNNIDIDKINIDKVDLSLINVEGLGIENKVLKRAVVWLLK